MKLAAGAFKLSEKQLTYATGLFILLVIILRYLHFPIGSPVGGDEPFYTQEAGYFAKYGFYKGIAQGTSFTYSLLLAAFAKLFSVSFLAAGRVLSVIFFVAGCRMLYNCLNAFTDLEGNVKYIAVIFYTTMLSGWLWRCLPDSACTFFIFAALTVIFNCKRYLHLVFAALLLFLAFSCKPVALFVLPGLFIYLFFKRINGITWVQNFLRLTIFATVFATCFICYHIPGYQTYHRLMLEEKSHEYSGETRIESTTSWTEVNNYFLLYKDVYNKQNKWAVSFAEVIEFKKQHPDVVLQMSYTQFVTNHFTIFLKSTADKFFFYLPYHIQGGLFFAKWTIINKWVKNTAVIYFITLILITAITLRYHAFIKDNALLFLIPFLYFSILSFYCISQLEDNWSFFCLPFLSLPVLKFVNKYVNISLFLVLHFLYTIILIRNG